MKLIFHGDDFGLTPGINRAILHAFKCGLLTSTSLVAGGEAVEEAIALARSHPELDVGVHLTLCDEPPVLPPETLSSLISRGSSLPPRAKIIGAILAGTIDHRQVEAEWRAQIEACLAEGIMPSHLDSHQYLHVFPGLFSICIRLASEYDICFVRTFNLDPISLSAGCNRLVMWIALSLWTKVIRPRSISPRITSIPSIGVLRAGGRTDGGSILTTLERIRAKKRHSVIEVILHPGAGDDYTREKYKHWGYQWQRDFNLLLDPLFAERLDRRGFEMTSFIGEK
jgi:predicted glycoside hydrolase/deacetylase ChbG (UPF0249 family)